MFHGSAPVTNLPLLPMFFATAALKRFGLSLLIRITVTEASAALATYA